MDDERAQPLAMRQQHPVVELVLPGTWMTVPVGDRDREDALLGWVRGSGPDGEVRAEQARAYLGQLARTGGDLMMVRQDRSTLLMTAWPPVQPPPALHADEATALAALRTLAGGEAVPVTSERGLRIVRTETETDTAPLATYWMAHPVSGRIFVLSVSDYVDGRGSTWLYDAVAGSISWEDVPLTS